MSKTRQRMPHDWKMSVYPGASADSRQQRRRRALSLEWRQWKIIDNGPKRQKTGPRDDHGIMSRVIRRAIALARFRKAVRVYTEAA